MRTALRLATLSVLLSASASLAGTITFQGPAGLSGTGVGNVLGVLSLQANGSEYGSTSWNGTTTVFGGDAKNNMHTQTAQAILTAGITRDNFGLIFQVNEAGSNAVNLNDFKLVFYAANGTPLGIEATYTEVGGEGNSLSGVGQGSSGYLFFVNLSQAEWDLFISNPLNRVGGTVLQANAITNTTDGPDNFFLVQTTPPTPPGGVVPEPGTLLLLGSGLGALGLLGRRRYGA